MAATARTRVKRPRKPKNKRKAKPIMLFAAQDLDARRFVLTAVAAALVWGVIAINRYIRSKKMERLCHSWNMEFTCLYNDLALRCLDATKLYHSKPHGTIQNPMTCELDDTRIVVFDYQAYRPAYSDRVDDPWQTNAMLLPKRQNFPVFQMRPETFTGKLMTSIGSPEIDFDEHPAFSSSYILQAENEKLVRKVFDKPLLDLLSEHPGWWIEGNRRGLIIFKKGKLMNADQIWSAMDLAVKLSKLLDSRGQQWLANDLAEVKGLSCMTWLPEAMAKMPSESCESI
jgi:hypothetical protein